MEIEAPKPKHRSSYYEMFNGDKWITLQHANKKKLSNTIHTYKTEVLCDTI